MKKRKGTPYKVLATAMAAAMLFAGTVSAEGPQGDQVQAPSVEDIVKHGQQILRDMQNQASSDAEDKLGYKNLIAVSS